MTSPSSSITIRSTPWVAGCWGPMLRIISSVWNSPAGMMSTPPPRTSAVTSWLWNAGRVGLSTIVRASYRQAAAPGPPRARPGAAIGSDPWQPPTHAARSPASMPCCAPRRVSGRPRVGRASGPEAHADRRARRPSGRRPPAARNRRSPMRSWRARSPRPPAPRTARRAVINATGVIIHTNLGRAPLADARRRRRAAARPPTTPTSRSTARPGTAARAAAAPSSSSPRSPTPRPRSS